MNSFLNDVRIENEEDLVDTINKDGGCFVAARVPSHIMVTPDRWVAFPGEFRVQRRVISEAYWGVSRAVSIKDFLWIIYL